MSRFSRAVVAAALAVAAAGGGLLTSAAGAAPAYAAAPADGHTVTMTAHPAARAASGISPQVAGEPRSAVLPCATAAGASCLPETLSCWMTEGPPMVMPDYTILATARVDCDDDAAEIDIQESLLRNHAPFVSNGITVLDDDHAGTYIQVACQPGTYTHSAVAHVTSPDGYSPATITLHITGADVAVSPGACTPPPPAGGGGTGGPVGGCATSTPSPSALPAADLPHLHTC